jgi:uncharacterized protein (TIGR00251 family)
VTGKGPSPLRAAQGDVLLSVFVKPNRSKSALLGARESDGREAGTSVAELEVALAAPPVDGAANAELVAFLAKRLRVPKASIVLESGLTSRHKVVRIRAADVELVRQALELGRLP